MTEASEPKPGQIARGMGWATVGQVGAEGLRIVTGFALARFMTPEEFGLVLADHFLATSSRAEQVAVSIAALGLSVRPRVVDGSRVAHAKPAPDLLLLAAEELAADPAATWYVGDATWDMRAAVAAGMVPIAVLAGAAVDEVALRSAGASIVLRTLDGLDLPV